ncbi:MAG: PD-(D/E)XK nuclease family protein [Burkholderiales bacterium]|nr:PD-(D/E)XK nuclease family protein [Burkholderiales bacterium]
MRVPVDGHWPERLAAAILDRTPADALASHVVLVPAASAAPGLRAAFGRECARRGQIALFTPRIVTLETWAASVPLPRAVQRPRERLARLYDVLKAREGLRGEGLWQVARALLAACDTLMQGVEPSEASVASLTRAVRDAYRGRAGEAASFEVRLVVELWRAMTSGAPEAPLDPGFAERLRVTRLAEEASAPLWVLEHRPRAVLPSPLAGFIERYARRAPVTVLAPDWGAARLALAHAAWRTGEEKRGSGQADGAARAPLAERARGIAVTGMPQLIHADSLEAEADAVAAVVRDWVVAGKREVALVALDRLAARRARALLERDGILVADEAGWRLSTTSAATALMRWLDCASADFPQADLIDLLRSPFVFADVAQERRKSVAAAVDVLVRTHNLTGGLASMRRALALSELDAALKAAVSAAFDALERAAAQLDAGRGSARDLAAWSDRLAASLDSIGLAGGLGQDAAGVEVAALLATLSEDARAAPGRLGFAEWRDWVTSALEEATFRDALVTSSVIMTDLRSLAMRRFDGVVLIGADAARLPGPPDAPLFLGAGLAAALGLPDAATRAAALRADLLHLLAVNDAVAVTWRDGERGEANPVAPPWALLDAAHRVACGAGLMRRHALPAARIAPVGTPRAAPRAPQLLPAMLSVSALQSLVDCPYRFFARHLLALDQPESVREELEKRDYGQWVHETLNRFHARHALLSGKDRASLEAELRAIADDVFAEAIAFNHLSLGWKLRFAARIPAYLAWQLDREADGWRYRDGELRCERELPLADGGRIAVKGRLDRVDVKASAADGSEEVAVLDYKTRGRSALRAALKVPGEDVQLPLYAWLYGQADKAMYIGLDDDVVNPVPEDGRPAADAATEAARFAAALGAVAGGARLAAHGATHVCETCEMRGLCRRDYAGGAT